MPPVIIAENLPVSLDASGRIVIDPDMIDYIATDNCAAVDVSLERSRLACLDIRCKTGLRFLVA